MGNVQKEWLYQVGSVLGVVAIFAWITEVFDIIYYELSLMSSISGLIILAAYYVVGRLSRDEEKFNFLYGWKVYKSMRIGSSESHETRIYRFLRFAAVTAVLVMPFMRNVHEQYFEESVISGAYGVIAFLLVIGIAVVFSAQLSPLRSDYANSVDQLAEVMGQIGEQYAGCKYFDELKSDIVSNLGQQKFLIYLSNLKWEEYRINGAFNWEYLALHMIKRRLESKFSLSGRGIKLSEDQEKFHIERLKVRTDQCITRAFGNETSREKAV
ncbi:MAG: hypothetical protein CL676_02960 [Bdellovibrionaceae bacterium]|nr:hypothetical protein [Pseudobdellovibrionaceae bacterium]|tara:strand:- start:7454 stop:8260 length:807 start_codon:yes stop_codon:yes gene_type:complete